MTTALIQHIGETWDFDDRQLTEAWIEADAKVFFGHPIEYTSVLDEIIQLGRSTTRINGYPGTG